MLHEHFGSVSFGQSPFFMVKILLEVNGNLLTHLYVSGSHIASRETSKNTSRHLKQTRRGGRRGSPMTSLSISQACFQRLRQSPHMFSVVRGSHTEVDMGYSLVTNACDS